MASSTRNFDVPRRKMNRRKDRRVFGKTAQNTRRENVSGNPMRGGIRL